MAATIHCYSTDHCHPQSIIVNHYHHYMQAAQPDKRQVLHLYLRSLCQAPPLLNTTHFFSLFLSGLNTPVARIQGYFVASLETLVRVYHTAFLNQDVLQAMTTGMQSSYISVREKYLKLLGAAASVYPKLLIGYYPVLLRGCTDNGISVRKASFRLVKDLVIECLSQYRQQWQQQWQQDGKRGKGKEDAISSELKLICQLYHLVLHTLTSDEESSIKEICVEVLCEIWLSNPPFTSSSSSSSTVDIDNDWFLVLLSRIAKLTLVRITEVEAESGLAVQLLNEGLQQLARGFATWDTTWSNRSPKDTKGIHRRTESENREGRGKRREQLASWVTKGLFQSLSPSSEDSENEEETTTTATAATMMMMNGLNHKHTRDFLDLLQVLSRIDSTLFIRQIQSIERCLEILLEIPAVDPRQRQLRTYFSGCVLEVLENVLKVSSVCSAVSQAEKCLVKIVTRGTVVSLVERAVQCLVVIVCSYDDYLN